ncbi:hypothetical protein [uncultured Roseibium sp.]|uniref:hypothetical protein n=1 Tax=uncultured Roseibium sp. TaxID=1936171 RepID=UPI002615F38C|nr:hypothetical protein [uncultured Roseibium sp.]
MVHSISVSDDIPLVFLKEVRQQTSGTVVQTVSPDFADPRSGYLEISVAYRRSQIRSGQAIPVPIRHIDEQVVSRAKNAGAGSKTG